MQRIRISGLETFDSANIFCVECNKAIIIDGDPQTPIYYAHDGFEYCSSCAYDKENQVTVSDVLFSSPCKETGFCRNPNCETIVAQYPETGNWYITFGHAGYNSPANNSSGYASKNKALAAWKRYFNKTNSYKVPKYISQ